MNKMLIGIEWEPQLTLLECENMLVVIQSCQNDLPFFGPNKDFWIIVEPIDSYKNGNKTKEQQVKILINSKIFDKFITSSPPNHLLTQYYSLLSTDMITRNLEVRTFPVPLSNLSEQIQNSNKFLTLFIKLLREHTKNDVGVFLPAPLPKIINKINSVPIYLEDSCVQFLTLTAPSKHISFSFEEDYNYIVMRDMELLISLPSKLYESPEYLALTNFKTLIKCRLSTIDYGKRLHITVPYNFTDYEILSEYMRKLWRAQEDNYLDVYIETAQYIDSWALFNPMPKPMLIAYTKKDKYIRLKGLI